MLMRIGRKLLWAAVVVFVVVPSMIAGMKKADEWMIRQMMREIGQDNRSHTAVATSVGSGETPPMVPTHR